MSIVFKGTDLKKQFVVVKYKYKKRYFLPRWGSKDTPYHYKAQLFNSEADAQTAIATTRANRKGHRYKIEQAENYFGYSSWSFRASYATPLEIEMHNNTEAVERSLKRDQKQMLSQAKDSFISFVSKSIADSKLQIENKQKEIKYLQDRINLYSISKDEMNALDVNALAEQYKTKSEDMAAILFTGKDEY